MSENKFTPDIESILENIRLKLIINGWKMILKGCLRWQQGQEKRSHRSIVY